MKIPVNGIILAWIIQDLSEPSKATEISSDLLNDPKKVDFFLSYIEKKIKESASLPLIRIIGYESEVQRATQGLSVLKPNLGKTVSVLPDTKNIMFFPRIGKVRIPSGSGVVSKAKKKVLVVDDSPTIGKLLKKIIDDDSKLECLAVIQDPRLVQEAIKKLRPDVVTMDIHMPEISGIELVRRIMNSAPVPIILISSLSMNEGGQVLEGLSLGAIDYIQKPSAANLDISIPIIREKILAASEAQIQPKTMRAITRAKSHSGIDLNSIIAIGASTGGTEAICKVLSHFPEQIPPVLIVQHIPAVFSKAFADRLNSLFKFNVKEAEDGDVVTHSTVYIAPGGKQMKVKSRNGKLIVTVDSSDVVNRHAPSVDVLFKSIAELHFKKVSACILTGMGNDGAKGLLALRGEGANTFAQDEKTSVVFGMPREAYQIGATNKVLPLEEMGDALLEALSGWSYRT